jgi:hypothetical protein
MFDFFVLGNIVCLFGTLFQIVGVIKNRYMLQGYAFVGSLLTFLSVVLFNYAFFVSGQLISMLFGLVTVIYWLLVTVYVGIKKYG